MAVDGTVQSTQIQDFEGSSRYSFELKNGIAKKAYCLVRALKTAHAEMGRRVPQMKCLGGRT